MEHEAQKLREHLVLLLSSLLETQRLMGPTQELPSAVELVQRCSSLERKTTTFENIVCVLNREVERAAMTAEACGRQHRLDQERIEALSNKVCACHRGLLWIVPGPGLCGWCDEHLGCCREALA